MNIDNRMRVIALAAIVATSSTAMSQSWITIGSGNWSLGSNWAGGIAPNGATANAALGDVGVPYTVTADIDVVLNSLNMHANSTLSMVSRNWSISGGAFTSNIDMRNTTLTVGTLISSGTFNSFGNNNLNGSNLANTGTLNVQGQNTGGFAVLNLSNTLNNGGVLNMTSINSAWGSTINGNIANSGTFNVLTGTGGNRTLNGEFHNSGLLNLETTLRINGATGLFRMASAAGNVFGASSLDVNGGRMEALSGSNSADIFVRGGELQVGTGFNGIVQARGSSTLEGGTGAGGTVEIKGASTGGTAAVTTNGFTNNGTTILTSQDASWSASLDAVGTFVNNGTFEVAAGAGGNRTVTGNYRNFGNLVGNSATLAFTNANVDMFGGQTIGDVTLRNSTLNFGTNSTATGVIRLLGANTVTGQNSTTNTLLVQGANTGGGANTTFNSFVNRGTVEMTSINSSWSSTINGTWTNMGNLLVTAGAGGPRTINGSVNNIGNAEFDASTIHQGGIFTHNGVAKGSSELISTDTLRITGGSADHTNGLVFGVRHGDLELLTSAFTGEVTAFGTSNFTGVIGSNAKLIVKGASSGGGSNLTFTAPTTNLGEVIMTSINTSWSSTINGDLDNKGVVRVEAGAGGLRTANGDMLNNGLYDINTTFKQTGTGTHVNNGTIELDGTFQFSGLGFNNNGTFSGNGTVTQQSSTDFTNNGVMDPGFSVGALDFSGTLINAAGGSFQMEIEGTNSGEWDTINANFLNLDGALNISTIGGFNASIGDTFRLFTTDNNNGVTGTFASVTTGWDAIYGADYLDVQFSGVPEPATFAVLGLGALAALRRRKKS
ncbi:MAG: PEP-CTERM sorting domain-containing protein [Armatimonadetes bacterium]|nr:PEP-CTERM sorting domain-containing protein [Armatimonadota bacterium]